MKLLLEISLMIGALIQGAIVIKDVLGYGSRELTQIEKLVGDNSDPWSE